MIGIGDQRKREAARGALLGLALGELEAGRFGFGRRSSLVATVLEVARCYAPSGVLHDGEFARPILGQHGRRRALRGELLPLFARWEAGMPVRLAARAPDGPPQLASDLPAAVLVPVVIATAGLPERIDRAARRLTAATITRARSYR